MMELDKELYNELKESAGDFRLFYSDKKVHVISLDKDLTVIQTWEEMARREGYDNIDFFKKQLTAAGRKALTIKIEAGCKRLISLLYTSMKKTDKGFTFVYSKGANAQNFTVTITSLTKSGNVFKKFKDHKAKAQKSLITHINKWSKKYSNRGVEGHWNEKSKSGKVQSNQIRRKTYTKDPKTGKTMASGSNDPFIDVGHQEGSEIGTLRALHAINFLQNRLENCKTSACRSATQTALDNMKDVVQWDYLNTLDYKGEMTKNVRATLESSRINKASMTKGEVAGLNKALFRGMSNIKTKDGWHHAAGSDSFFDMAEKTIVAAIVGKISKNKNVKIHGKKVKWRETKNSKTPAQGKKRKIGAKKLKGPAYRKVPITRLRKSKKETKSAAPFQPLHMIGLINKELPDAVENNMGRPRLESVTGRFARSTTVTDITTTPQGFPSIGYTYQLSPYQTFEGDDDYDPRTLIDQSIRAVAVKFAMGRFYTRRVG